MNSEIGRLTLASVNFLTWWTSSVSKTTRSSIFTSDNGADPTEEHALSYEIQYTWVRFPAGKSWRLVR